MNDRGRIIKIIQCVRLDYNLIILELTIIIESLNNIGCLNNYLEITDC